MSAVLFIREAIPTPDPPPVTAILAFLLVFMYSSTIAWEAFNIVSEPFIWTTDDFAYAPIPAKTIPSIIILFLIVIFDSSLISP